MNRRLPILQVSPHLFRSPQPDFEDFLYLKTMGIKTVVNLREEATESEFFARQAELHYLHLPVVDWQLPSPEQINQFLELLEDSGKTPTLVHCAMGVGRTGTFVCCHRIRLGMEPEAAISLTNSESPLPGVTMNREQMQFVRSFGNIR